MDRLLIKGFKSFSDVEDFKLGKLNVLIGANGCGKSNFIQIFTLISAMMRGALSDYVLENGGADSFLFGGPQKTSSVSL